MYDVCPFGERRKDIRAAIHTANMICAQSMQKVSDADFSDIVSNLASYLPCEKEHDPEEDDANPEALARIKET
jgi:hypothetical protein